MQRYTLKDFLLGSFYALTGIAIWWIINALAYVWTGLAG